ncbi:hypothetical protein MRY82_02685 [bacterium]|nr:hypothetical protein [bacterium]
MHFKIIIVFALLSFEAFSQNIKTFPLGFHALDQAQKIVPEYTQAIAQASQLIGRVLSEKENGTAYLFYNDKESRWEAHSAYHVVEDEVAASLPLVMELMDKTWITLDPNKIVSTQDEHDQDRVRYEVEYSGEKPNKVVYQHSSSIESGTSIVVMGYPHVTTKIKTSFGHALMTSDRGFWLSTATTQTGSSGSPVMALGEEGELKLLGTVVIAHNIEPFMVVSYNVIDKRLPSVLSTMDFNAWIMEVSKPKKSLDKINLDIRTFFTELLSPYIGKMNVYPETVGAWYQVEYQKIIHDLKDFLQRAKLRVADNPHQAAQDIKKGLIEYYSRNNLGTTKINTVDFPLLTQHQWNHIAPKDLKPILLDELDKSIGYLDEYAERLRDIAQLFMHEQLEEVIVNARRLNIIENEENFEHYNIPMMSSISAY